MHTGTSGLVNVGLFKFGSVLYPGDSEAHTCLSEHVREQEYHLPQSDRGSRRGRTLLIAVVFEAHPARNPCSGSPLLLYVCPPLAHPQLHRMELVRIPHMHSCDRCIHLAKPDWPVVLGITIHNSFLDNYSPCQCAVPGPFCTSAPVCNHTSTSCSLLPSLSSNFYLRVGPDR